MDEKLEKLKSLGQYLSSSRAEDQILDMAMTISRDVLGFDHAIIRFVEGYILISRKWIGFPREAANLLIRVGEGISGEVAKTGATILVEDTLKDPRFLRGVEGARSELCAPIKYNEKTIGVFNVESEQPAFFTDRDKTLLETLAAQVANAIEMARLRDELERTEKLSVIGSMASSILHDIRNDIHQLRVCSDLMKKKDASPEFVEMVSDTVRKAGDNIYGLIEDIFEFVKTGSSRLDRKREKLAPLIDAAMVAALSSAQSGIEPAIDAEADIELYMDKRRFRRVMLNLLNNAVEAMPDGGTLSVYAKAEGDEAVIEVADSGVGIEREMLAKIWEPLYTHGKKHGTGLGMAIVKKIVNDHGWKVSLSSEPGVGTTFVIRAPLAEHDSKAREAEARRPDSKPVL